MTINLVLIIDILQLVWIIGFSIIAGDFLTGFDPNSKAQKPITVDMIAIIAKISASAFMLSGALWFLT